MRLPLLGVVILAAVGGAPASAQPYPTWNQATPYTTRIEPRPFYGATVTMEAGVRVFRPLPPHDRVIIDPSYTTAPYRGGRR
jgi:hypothetical protein